jgi:hypothetical protein
MNSSIRTPEEVLSTLSKPDLLPVNNLTLAPDDWLILCGGFEERAIASIERSAANTVPFNVLLVHYEPAIAENKVATIEEICNRAGITVTHLTYDRQDPAGFGELLLETLRSSRGRLFVDISGMSRLLIVQTLVALGTRTEGFAGCFIVYIEAENYPPSQKEAEAELNKSESDPSFQIFFLSSGVSEVTLVPELASRTLVGLQNRLVAFPSLDAHQLIALRAELQPSRLTVIEGIPPDQHNQWREKVIALVNHLDEISQSDRYRVSTLRYGETLDGLLNIYRKHSVHERLLISPTGSKMQAVAVGILRAYLDDVQIVYPTPQDFLKPERYTSGVSKMHLLSLESFSKTEPTDLAFDGIKQSFSRAD